MMFAESVICCLLEKIVIVIIVLSVVCRQFLLLQYSSCS